MGKRVNHDTLKVAVATLSAIPGISQGQIAETLGVCRQTIAKVEKQVKSETEEILTGFQAQLRESVPFSFRAQKYRELIDLHCDKGEFVNPMVALKALERVDTIEFGDLRRDNGLGGSSAVAPLFSLPAGSRVAIQIGDGKTRGASHESHTLHNQTLSDTGDSEDGEQ